jgi:hypothetical protein
MGEALILKLSHALRFLALGYFYPECPGTTQDEHDPKYERTSCRGFPESRLPHPVRNGRDEGSELLRAEGKDDPPPAYEERAEMGMQGRREEVWEDWTGLGLKEG